MHTTFAGCEEKLRAAIAPILNRQPNTSLAALEWGLSRDPLGGSSCER